jgi:hypothetical protein
MPFRTVSFVYCFFGKCGFLVDPGTPIPYMSSSAIAAGKLLSAYRRSDGVVECYDTNGNIVSCPSVMSDDGFTVYLQPVFDLRGVNKQAIIELIAVGVYTTEGGIVPYIPIYGAGGDLYTFLYVQTWSHFNSSILNSRSGAIPIVGSPVTLYGRGMPGDGVFNLARGSQDGVFGFGFMIRERILDQLLRFGLFIPPGRFSVYMISLLFSFEASPEALIPNLDYNEYMKYSELRNVIGYRYCDGQMLNYAPENCMAVGWNADDMVNILKQLFKDREWYVYDDAKNILYANNPVKERLDKLTLRKGVQRVESIK